MVNGKELKILEGDIKELTRLVDDLVEMVSEPDKTYKKYLEFLGCDESLMTKELFILGEAYRMVVWAYLRGKGLKWHPSSKTREKFDEQWRLIMDAIRQLVKERPGWYEHLAKLWRRGLLDIELRGILLFKGGKDGHGN